MKRILPIFVGLLMFVAATKVNAAALILEKIGTSDYTSGSSTWTYYGTNPVFQGSASPSATVSLSVDGDIEASATADTSGDWSLTPTSMGSVGSYEINFSSGAESILLTLNIASFSATESAQTSTGSGDIDLPETLPETGSEDILFLLGIGGIMLAAGVSSGVILKE